MAAADPESAGTTGPDPSAGARPWWRREGAAFVELFALAGFAIAQPLLDIFGRNPTQFAFREAAPADIVLFALAVTLLAPVALWAAGALVGVASTRLRRVAHLGAVALLTGMFAVQAGRSLTTGALLLVASALAAIGGAVLVQRLAVVRLWLRFAAAAPVAFVALFLFASDTAPLIRGGDVETADAAVGSPAPVVMIVFDEFPLTALVRSDGTIDEELYPNFAELAAGSTWFRNATTVSNSTWHAIPSIVTGRLPRDGTAPVVADHPQSIFTLLGDSYEMNVTESFVRLCPPEVCGSRTATPAAESQRTLLRDAAAVMRDRLSYSGESSDVTAGLVEAGQVTDPDHEVDPEPDDPDPGDDGPGDFGASQPDRFRTFLDGLGGPSSTLHYLHMLLPHVPYRFLPSGVQYHHPEPDISRPEDDQWSPEPWLATLARQRLQLQVGYMDTLVGELIATLRQRGLYDDALIVLTADHGISFEPGGPVRALEGQPIEGALLAELAWVPLIVKQPGQVEGTVSDANALTIDLVPTIADVLDVDVPWPVDGRSLLGPERPTDLKPFHASKVHTFGPESEEIDHDGDEGWRHVTSLGVDRFLPPAGEPHRLWRPGPGSDLVGSTVADAPDGTWTPVEAELRDPGRYDLEAGASTVPALVRARVAPEHAGEELAVAVNGVVGAVAPVVPVGDGWELAVMVDADLFRAGSNEVTVHRPAG